MKKLGVLLGLLVCPFAFAEEVDVSGIYNVKSKVMMSSCENMSLESELFEQWIVNTKAGGYRIQVNGNSNPKLTYNAVQHEKYKEILMGKYSGFNDISEIQIALKKSETSNNYDLAGLRVLFMLSQGCSSVMLIDAKKIN